MTRFLFIAFLLQIATILHTIYRHQHQPLQTTSLHDALLPVPSAGISIADLSSGRAATATATATDTDTHSASNENLNTHQLWELNHKKRRFAYVFLMAGCDPKHPEKYIGYVLNILISKHILHKSGSKADVVVLTRMSSETPSETIPEQSLLSRAGIIVQYLPKTHTDNFYSAMLDKFHVLHMTQYDRVLFMDSDVAPFCNLDYMFWSSVGPRPILAPNVVLSYKREPAQGGFFMVQPEEGDYERLQEIIRHRIQNFDDFSEEYGWGHKIVPPDGWSDLNSKNQTLWTFYGAYADQGLLYHWVKYEKSNVTIVHYRDLDLWGEVDPEADPSSMLLGPIPVTERNKTIGFIKRTLRTGLPTCGGMKMKLKRGHHVKGHSPCCDYHHFTGANKPWLAWKRPDNIRDIISRYRDHVDIKDTIVWWYYWLNRVKEDLNLDIDIQNFEASRPRLGLKVPKDYMFDYNKKQREIARNVTLVTQHSLIVDANSSAPLTSSNPQTPIHPSDASCPFRNSPLYRSIYIYPTPNFALGPTTGLELSRQNSIYSPKGGQSNNGILRPYPWIEWDNRTRHEGKGWGHYNVSSQMGQYTTELIVRDILSHPDSCLAAANPEEAKLFYVPYLPSMEFHKGRVFASDYSTSPYGQAIYDALEGNYDGWEDYFGFTSQYWKRNNGSDHILVWSEPLHGYSHPRNKRGNHHFIHTQRLLKPAIGVVVEVSTTFVEMFPKCAAKNVLVPYPNPDGRWFNGKLDEDAIMLLGQNAETEPTTEEGASRRPVDYYYSAGNHGTCANLRRSMKADYKCTPSHNKLSKMAAGGKIPSYEVAMRLSKICPCPGGDSPSAKRNFDSILAGCIPLLLSHDFVWPFSQEFDPNVDVDPNDFSIRLSASEYIEQFYSEDCTARKDSGGLPITINAIISNATEIKRLQRGVKKAAHLYSFYRRGSNMQDNPLRESILPEGGAAFVLLEALAARVGGERWRECERELEGLAPDLPEVKSFKC